MQGMCSTIDGKNGLFAARGRSSTTRTSIWLACDQRPARCGFTLVELMVVVVIIGIILSLILVAGMDAANRANGAGHAVADHQTRARIQRSTGSLAPDAARLHSGSPRPREYLHGLDPLYAVRRPSTGYSLV